MPPAARASIPEVTHHEATVDGTHLHYVRAGQDGTPILLVHGFPESWWAFHRLIPLLAADHRVIAVDLPGFGDSGTAPGDYTSTSFATALRDLIELLDLGPVHLSGQDISGTTTYRLASQDPELVRSLTAIETALPGYGLEQLADVAHGGMWHVGFLAAPGMPEMLLTGREREFLTHFALPAMCGTDGAITQQDIDELTRVYSRPDGLRGTAGIYGSMLDEGDEVRSLGPLTVPVLAVDAGSGDLTSRTMTQLAADITVATLRDVGHLAALEAPEQLADAMLEFYRRLDPTRRH